MEKKFLKKSHVSVIPILVLGYISLFVLGVVVIISRRELIIYVAALLLMTLVLVILLVNYYKTEGIYIYGDKIYSKKFRKKYINPNEIRGVIIIPSYSAGGKYRGFYPLKDNKGDDLYTAIFVKQITLDMKHFNKGDLWFIQKFKQYIITWSVYSENAINYLKSLDDTIEIIKI